MEHKFYQCQCGRVLCKFCDAELLYCVVCKQAEAELTPECPGPKPEVEKVLVQFADDIAEATMPDK